MPNQRGLLITHQYAGDGHACSLEPGVSYQPASGVQGRITDKGQ